MPSSVKIGLLIPACPANTVLISSISMWSYGGFLSFVTQSDCIGSDRKPSLYFNNERDITFAPEQNVWVRYTKSNHGLHEFTRIINYALLPHILSFLALDMFASQCNSIYILFNAIRAIRGKNVLVLPIDSAEDL